MYTVYIYLYIPRLEMKTAGGFSGAACGLVPPEVAVTNLCPGWALVRP